MLTKSRRHLTNLFLLAAGVIVLVLVSREQIPSFDARPSNTALATHDPQAMPDGEALRRAVQVDRLETDVARLSSDEFGGRENGTAGSDKTRRWLLERLRGLGLEPAFGDLMEQPILDGEHIHGTNVGAMIRGTGEDPEVVCLVAHFAHLGREGAGIHRGADDNASGVAIALEIARILRERAFRPKHHVLFLFPDCEEPPDVRTPHMGSTWFVEHGPFPVEKLRVAVVLDCMGGTPLSADPDCFFVLGAETSAELETVVRSVPQPISAGRYELLSAPMIESVPYRPWVRKSKSDYHAFREHGRPFLFLTAGTTPRYHTTRDTADSLAYDKMAAECGFVADLMWRLGMHEKPIDFNPKAVSALRDLDVTRRLMDAVLAEPGDIHGNLLKALEDDQEELVELSEAAAERGELDRFQYRRLTVIGLRLQVALTRPKWWWARFF